MIYMYIHIHLQFMYIVQYIDKQIIGQAIHIFYQEQIC